MHKQSNPMSQISITPGFTEDERPLVATLFWQAFGQKLGRIMSPEKTALAFIADVLDPSHALTARDGAGTLLGVVGFKTYKGALVDGDWADIRRHYGIWGGIWRVGLLALLDRDVDNARFLMDGIFVTAEARGQGIGTLLIKAICAEAETRGYAQIRLDVIDTNPRARALYERYGFVATDTQSLGPLRHLFRFNTATTMVKTLF